MAGCAAALTSLTALDLAGPYSPCLEASAWPVHVSAFASLASLDCSRRPRLSARSLGDLLLGAPKAGLTALNLSRCRNLGRSALAPALSRLTNLRQVWRFACHQGVC